MCPKDHSLWGIRIRACPFHQTDVCWTPDRQPARAADPGRKLDRRVCWTWELAAGTPPLLQLRKFSERVARFQREAKTNRRQHKPRRGTLLRLLHPQRLWGQRSGCARVLVSHIARDITNGAHDNGAHDPPALFNGLPGSCGCFLQTAHLLARIVQPLIYLIDQSAAAFRKVEIAEDTPKE